jgi:hypothetical protein
MLWRRRPESELLPWYRDREYKGSLTESEKQKLDAFRSEANHPSARYEELPAEVQKYIAGLELQIYDLKQEKAVAKAMLCTAAAIAFVWLYYRPITLSAFWVWAVGLLLVIVPWLAYRFEWHKNAQESMPDKPGSAIDEAIRREWEVNYVSRSQDRHGTNA